MLSLLCLLLVPFGALAAPTSVTTPSPCADILIITARGSEELQSPSTSTNSGFDGGQIVNAKDTVGYAGTSGEGEMGVVAQQVQSIIQKWTSYKVAREAVFYPAMLRDESGAIVDTIYGQSLIEGIANLTKQIITQATVCPKQKLVLMGYSQGANLVGDTLAGGGGCYGTAPNCTNPFFAEGQYGETALDTKYTSLISSILFWGDPRHVQTAQAKFTVGFPAPKHGGFFARTPDSEAVLEANYCPKSGTCKIKSICTAGDFFCASGAGAISSTNLTKSNEIHDYSYLTSAPAKASSQFLLGSLGFPLLELLV